MSWTEEAFWACSWGGFLDAWAGHRTFVLGAAPEDAPVSRDEAEALDLALAHWQRSGTWTSHG